MMAVSTVTLRIALKLFLIFAIRKPSLINSSSCCYCFHGEEVCDTISTNTYESIHVYMENISYIKVRPKIAAQILLIMSGDVETCPGPERSEVKQDDDRILTKKRAEAISFKCTWTFG